MSVTRDEERRARKRAVEILNEARIPLTPQEKEEIEIEDYGLGDLNRVGTEVITYVNTNHCARELVLFPQQICPEHRHPPFDDNPGKQKTLRCRWGEVYLHVPGEETPRPKASPPEGRKDYYTAQKEITLTPGDQHTIPPDTEHWFQAGERGAVISEFSSKSADVKDVFTDPKVKRTHAVTKR